MLSASLAVGLDAWLRLLTFHGQEDLADAEPDTIAVPPLPPPARLSRHVRRRWLRIGHTWLTAAMALSP
ncbi:hypothetical protein [Streptomyces sp. NPDC001774]